MATLHTNIPPLHCYLRKEFLYDNLKHHGEFEEVYVFGMTSIRNWAPTFTIMTTRGAQFTRIPLHALVHKEDAPNTELDLICLWDCFSYNFSICRYDFLKNSRARVFLPNKEMVLGSYLWTVDWFQDSDCDTGFSEVPEGHKTAHLIKLDNGLFTMQPNNRIYWFNRDWVVNPFKDNERPDYQVNTSLWTCEGSARWKTEDNNNFFYNVKEVKDEE